MTTRKTTQQTHQRCITNPPFCRGWFTLHANTAIIRFGIGFCVVIGLIKDAPITGWLKTGKLLAIGLLAGGLMTGGLLLSGCSGNEMPKPYAYARLQYPSTPHQTFQLPGHPYRFEYPGFFSIKEKPSGKPDTRWVDLRWPAYGVTLFTTYRHRHIASSAEELAVQMKRLLTEKLPQHTTLTTRLITLPDSTLKAYLFEVEGPTSIPFEFLLTDGKENLFQGIVQFDQALDRDSLADIIHGISVDMYRLITTFTFYPQP